MKSGIEIEWHEYMTEADIRRLTEQFANNIYNHYLTEGISRVDTLYEDAEGGEGS